MQTARIPRTYTYKMVILGHYSVGKSSIALNFVKGEFNPNEESTIGASFLTKTIVGENHAIKYEIWDTAGQERYYSLIPMYYRGAHVALIVYDVTSELSLETAKNWVEELKYDKPQEFLKVLVCNKKDLQKELGEGEVDLVERGRDLAAKEGLKFYEVSAKTGEGVERLFSEIAEALPKTTPEKKVKTGVRKAKSKVFCC
ncbi:Ras-related protein Rab-5A [Pancytospora epiphaga]|nr:Ras-related protein Rab-5A [Pancytospora epiphaga]